MTFLIALALIALLATVLACAWLSTPKRNLSTTQFTRQKGFKRHWRRTARLPDGLPRLLNFLPGRPLKVEFANAVADGTHEGAITRKVDAAVATRYLMAKEGTDDDHVAACAAADIPIGVMTDEAKAAEDNIAIELLGISKRTLLMVASEAIDAGEYVYTAAGGKIQNEPAIAGTYYLVGKALSDAAADGDQVEVAHCHPIKLVVQATFGNTDNEIGALAIGAAYSQAEVTALRDKAEELADDVRAIRTSLASPALLKIL